jgi:hypothetical protein
MAVGQSRYRDAQLNSTSNRVWWKEVEGGVSEMLMLPSVEEVNGEVSDMKVRGWHWEVAKFRAQGKVMGSNWD